MVGKITNIDIRLMEKRKAEVRLLGSLEEKLDLEQTARLIAA
jgi:hypothetical protein